MIIAIPSVTRYISDSRKNAYVDTAKEIVGGARNIVNGGKLEMYATDTTYYIPTSCVKTENASKSPYGDFTEAYIGVIYDGKGYKYYWISVDDAGQGVSEITPIDKLDTDSIESDLKREDIKNTVETTGIGSRTKIKILNCTNNSWDGQYHLDDISGNIPEEGGQTAANEIIETAQTAGQLNQIPNTNIYIYKGGTLNPPANYVKFNNEDWRIIGIYGGQLKIQRVEELGRRSYKSSETSSAWATSDLKTYLNTTYYNTLSSSAKSMIDDTAEWNVGFVHTYAKALDSYTKALVTKWKGTDSNEPGVGLVASYEYLYASGGSGCDNIASGYRAFNLSCGTASYDWMKPDSDMWTLSPSNSTESAVLNLNTDGSVGHYRIIYGIYFSPAVFLKSSVKIISGDGTSPENAYILG